ncbi:MAG TPA: enolase C-terminal domain-like protein, partial [Flavobacteriales bacterium]|nr:enolase C-terminal domain-like protein [Flavobacteriales bacterium]
MPIVRITLHPLSIPLKAPFITSLGALEAVANVVVIIHTRDGRTGQGECSPFWTINGETQQTCLSVGEHLARALIGHEATDIAGAHARMDRLIHANNSIKSAFDIALHDIAAQHAGVPLYRFLGGANEKPLFTDYTVSLKDPEAMAADALAIVRAGFPVMKVKLGSDGDLDIERIRRIREAIGPGLPLRIDANQGWDPATAVRVLNALASFNIQHCEEPIRRWQ